MSILQEIEDTVRRYCFFDNEHKYVVMALWIAGTPFLWCNDIKVFNAFPYLGFMSPEPESGKTRALELTAKLSYNGVYGKFTPAAMLRLIDQEKNKKDTYLTLCTDEIDEVFKYGNNNSDLIQLYNLGYQRGAEIVRCQINKDGVVRTPAYFPKAFAGLSAAHIPETTKTRTIIIKLRPLRETDNKIEKYIDATALETMRRVVQEWAHSVQDQLKSVEIDEIDWLSNRKEQIWDPLLAIAKISGEEWYDRARKASEYFTKERTDDATLGHKILKACYVVYLNTLENSEIIVKDRIHSNDLLNHLHELEIPKYIDTTKLKDCITGYDIHAPKQIKIIKTNRNGYEWSWFEKAWSTYLSEQEKKEIEDSIKVDR